MANQEHATPGVGAPIPQYKRRFTVFLLPEIYTGPDGKGQEWPNVNDLIIDYDLGIFRRVTDVDYTNYTYKWVEFKPARFFNTNSLVGGAAPHLTDTFRIYVDTSKHPHTMRVDARQWFADPDLVGYRLFRGTNIGSDGEIISAYFKNNIHQGDVIPVMKAVDDNPEGNGPWMRPMPGACIIAPDNGELVTMVLYAATGEVAAVALYNIYVTNLVMAAEKPAKILRDIRLKSSYLDPADDRRLLLPINMPEADLVLQAELVYNHGIETIMVDGQRAQLDGLRNSGAHDTYFISTQVGQDIDLLLKYRLSSDEMYIGEDLRGNVISREYTATTDPVRGAYSLKLFVSPRWLDEGRGWRLDYYLMDLNRGSMFRATDKVYPAKNAPTFDPTLYGTRQRLAVVVDAADVSNQYTPHPHPQQFSITLLGKGTDKRDNFLIEYHQGKPEYGKDLYAKFYYENTTFWKLDITCGIATKTEWLRALYDTIYPLYDRSTEAAAPRPTHMQIVTSTKTYLKTVDEWVTPFTIDFQVKEGETILIKWIFRTPTDDLLLGVSPLVCHQTVTKGT